MRLLQYLIQYRLLIVCDDYSQIRIAPFPQPKALTARVQCLYNSRYAFRWGSNLKTNEEAKILFGCEIFGWVFCRNLQSPLDLELCAPVIERSKKLSADRPIHSAEVIICAHSIAHISRRIQRVNIVRVFYAILRTGSTVSCLFWFGSFL